METSKMNDVKGRSLKRHDGSASVTKIRDVCSAELLSQLVRYEPSTGLLFWKERATDLFNTGGQASRWNKCFAGKQAFKKVNANGYLVGKLFSKCVSAHRVAYAVYYGVWPDLTDHIDGDRKNNRIENLRSVNFTENNRNREDLRSRFKSGSGVRLNQRGNSWRASIGFMKQNIFLGSFKTKQEAVAARAAAEKLLLKMYGPASFGGSQIFSHEVSNVESYQHRGN